jgi:hypothetical protein
MYCQFPGVPVRSISTSSGDKKAEEIVFPHKNVAMSSSHVMLECPRTVRNYKGQSCFVIYLPTARNDVWNFLWERKIPIKVFIEIPEGAIKESEDREGD